MLHLPCWFNQKRHIFMLPSLCREKLTSFVFLTSNAGSYMPLSLMSHSQRHCSMSCQHILISHKLAVEISPSDYDRCCMAECVGRSNPLCSELDVMRLLMLMIAGLTSSARSKKIPLMSLGARTSRHFFQPATK
jgi:hypothetical protein